MLLLLTMLFNHRTIPEISNIGLSLPLTSAPDRTTLMFKFKLQCYLPID